MKTEKRPKPVRRAVKRPWERHPWDAWLASKKFTLLKGEDYNSQSHGMAQQVRNKMSKAGLRVSIHVGSSPERVEVQVLGRSR